MESLIINNVVVTKINGGINIMHIERYKKLGGNLSKLPINKYGCISQDSNIIKKLCDGVIRFEEL